MNIVKFRAKQKYVGQWVFGDYIQRRHSDMKIIGFVQDGKYHSAIIEKETVGQFTNLYINETQEVYEGDLLKVFCANKEDFLLYEVVFSKKHGAWWSRCKSLHLKKDLYKPTSTLENNSFDEYLVNTLPKATIVGTIHEDLDMAFVINEK